VTTRTGLFWDFWDDRIGIPINKPHDVEEYCNGISKIVSGEHAFEPRSVILEKRLDLENWRNTWVKFLAQDVVSALST
jgi:hypothetical protein